MIGFSKLPPDNLENQWRYQLDEFVQKNQQELAALAWGLLQEWGNNQETLGIDLQPQPHFVCCSREALEKLNHKVHHRLQEILGVLDGYKPEEEVVIIGIGKGQLKLINFQPNPSPPVCFEQVELDLDSLIQQLENRLIDYLYL
jgi:hypothetical protein